MARARGSFGNNWHEEAGAVRLKCRSRHKNSWGGICYGSGLGIGDGCRHCLDWIIDGLGKIDGPFEKIN